MRKIFICFIILNISNILSAQELQKAVVVDQFLHKLFFVEDMTFISGYYKNKTAFLYSSSEKQESYTRMRASSNYTRTNYPLCWDLYNNNIYPVAGLDEFGGAFSFFKVPVIFVDTLTYKSIEKATEDSLRQIYKTEKEYRDFVFNVLWRNDINKSNSRGIPPISHLPRELEGRHKDFPLKPGSISFDIAIIDSVNIEFYIRDMKQITRWHYKYPPTYLDKQAPDAWIEIATYSSDTLGSYPYLEKNLWIMNLKDGWQTNPKADRVYKRWTKVDPTYTDKPYIPSGKKHIYESIKDSLFFKGHFKITIQNGQRYIINTLHGSIYIITPSEIAKIGQVNMNGYREVNGEKYL